MSNTSEQFDEVIGKCREVYLNKFKDYGTAWRIMRTKSLTDQIFIKAQRIRTIEETGETKVDEGIIPEFIGIVNYGIMSLVQLEADSNLPVELTEEMATTFYDRFAKEAKELMMNKNHDYGEAWRSMRVSSYTDLILMKLHRTKQIEDNDGSTIVSEGIDANYFDIINYSVFGLIKLIIENKE